MRARAHTPRGVAVYGFAEPRKVHSDRLLKQDEIPIYIDDFNAILGLNDPGAFLFIYFDLLNFLKNAGPMTVNPIPGRTDRYCLQIGAHGFDLLTTPLEDMIARQRGAAPDDDDGWARFRDMQYQRVLSWANFLRENINRIDVRSRLNAAMPPRHMLGVIPRPPHKAAANPFILKNTSSEQAGTALGDIKVRQRLAIVFTQSNSYQMLHEKLRQFPRDRASEYGRWIGSAVSNAFFRQTSKLGLLWFAEFKQGMNIDRIDFVVNDYHGRFDFMAKAEARLHRQIKVDAPGRHHEPITHSELRHALRRDIDVNFLVRRLE